MSDAGGATARLRYRGAVGDAGEGTAVEYGYAEHKADYLARLRRIEGQVRGLQRMVDGDEYCIDILQQVAAIDGALQRVAIGLLGDHVGHCVADAAAGGDD